MEEKIRGIPFDANEVVLPDGSLGYDNVIYSSDFAEWMSTYFKNGVLVAGGAILDQELKVTKVDSTHVKINVGNIVVNGRTGFVTSPISVEIPASEPNKFRTDRLVIELNIKETVNCFMLKLIKGETKKSPTPPSITRTNEVYHMSLATITSGVSGINKVEDDRPEESLCGISQVLIGVRPALPVTGDSASNISYNNYYSGNTETVQTALDNLNNPANQVKIKEDGVLTKNLNLTIRESWLNVGEIPTPPKSEPLYNAKNKYYGKPVELDGYLYGMIHDNSKSPVKDQLVKFDEKGYEVVCDMPYNSSPLGYFCKYKDSLYIVYRYYSSSVPNGEIWKFNPNTKSFTKVATIPTVAYDVYGAIEFSGNLHFFIRTTNAYHHYKFDGTSITLVTSSSPFVNINTLYGVRKGYLYALYNANNIGSEETYFFKRFNGTSWSDYATKGFYAKIPFYYEQLQNIPFLIDDNHFMYLQINSSQFADIKSGDTFDNGIIAPYYQCSGSLLMYKGKLTFLSGYSRVNDGGNGSYNNFFVREKILCLEG